MGVQRMLWKTKQMEVVCLRMPVELLEQVRLDARDKDVQYTYLLREIIRGHYDLPPEKPRLRSAESRETRRRDMDDFVRGAIETDHITAELVAEEKRREDMLKELEVDVPVELLMSNDNRLWEADEDDWNV